MRARVAVVFGAWLVSLVIGCNIKAAGDDDPSGPSGGSLPDLDELEDTLRDAAGRLDELEICPGYTAEELLQADSLSAECRDALLSFLPEPESTFEGRLLAPGGVRTLDGELQVLLHAVDADGVALDAAALASLQVYATEGGSERLLAEGEYEVTLTADLPAELLSVAVVNDLSASMTENDLRDVEDLERALFSCLPKIHETELIRFSTTVDTRLPFSTDAEAIYAALALDPDYERSTTALLDALGTAATDLAARTRPVRILVLSTDGRENASQDFDQSAVLALLDEHDVFVISFAALLADVDFIRELSEGRGVFAYTREFSGLAGAAAPYCDALRELVELHIALPDPPPEGLRLTAGELELRLDVVVGP